MGTIACLRFADGVIQAGKNNIRWGEDPKVRRRGRRQPATASEEVCGFFGRGFLFALHLICFLMGNFSENLQMPKG